MPDSVYNKLGNQGFLIRRFGADIYIAGKTPKGTLFGVYYFLEEYTGIKWLAPDFTVIPKMRNLIVDTDTFRKRYIPRFRYREMFFKDGDEPLYRVHNRLNGSAFHRKSLPADSTLNVWSDYWPPGNHNYHQMVPDRTYWAGGQLKAMNDSTRAIATRNLLSKIQQRKKQGKDPSYGFSQEDTRWQPDLQSQIFAKKHGDALSAPVVNMVSDIAARIRKTVPDARLTTLAYKWSFPPPKGLKVPDYVVMTLAPIEANLGLVLNEGGNEQTGMQIKHWAGLASNIVVWDYLVNFGGYIQPFPNITSMCRSIRFLAGLPSVKGYFGQGSYSTPGVPFADMHMWIAAKLLWNPDQDSRGLLRQFAKGYYGDAAPYILQYLDLLDKSFAETHSELTIRTPVTASYLSFDTMYKADKLFRQAIQAVKNEPQYLEHVNTARIGVDYIILIRRNEFRRESVEQGVQWNPNADQRIHRFKENVKVAGLKSLGEDVGDVKALFETVSIARKKPSLPEFVQTLPDSSWQEYNDLDIRNYSARYVADSIASDGGALRIRGEKKLWGIQLPLKRLPRKGKWKFFIETRVNPLSTNDSLTAFRAGVYPGGQKTLKVSLKEVKEGKYHLFRVPGMYQHNNKQYLYFEPRGSSVIKYLYVDRVIAVKEKS